MELEGEVCLEVVKSVLPMHHNLDAINGRQTKLRTEM